MEFAENCRNKHKILGAVQINQVQVIVGMFSVNRKHIANVAAACLYLATIAAEKKVSNLNYTKIATK